MYGSVGPGKVMENHCPAWNSYPCGRSKRKLTMSSTRGIFPISRLENVCSVMAASFGYAVATARCDPYFALPSAQ